LRFQTKRRPREEGAEGADEDVNWKGFCSEEDPAWKDANV